MMERLFANKPALILAPMEGVTDAPMRALMTERGGFTHCVSEFLRVSQEIPPAKVFYRHVPELRFESKTPSGVPVQVQLLGGNAEKMARAARVAVECGATGIDINFGCPAPTVNRHDGGATLLKYPERIESIVAAVRTELPHSVPVSAKLRLGWDSPESIFENARRAEKGGADWITIHARTKMQGYQPPVFWNLIGQVRTQVSIPVVANGDIWNYEDFERCAAETGCIHFMLGRGALGNPSLVHAMARALGIKTHPNQIAVGETKRDWLPLLTRFVELNQPFSPGPQHSIGRIKQWLGFAHRTERIGWFHEVKRSENLEELFRKLNSAVPSPSINLKF